MPNKLTTEVFIAKARKVYGDKYDYPKVEYVDRYTKIIITCLEHGDFIKTPNNFLRGSGCSKCKKNERTTEQWIVKAQLVHGDRYGYSKAIYSGSRNKIIITCHEHGNFPQKSDSHLRGSGCPKCQGYYKTTEDWIKDARLVHGDKYDYSEVVYVNSYTNVIIKCSEHGKFLQTPNAHLNNHGCSDCYNVRRGRKKDTAYFIQKARIRHGDKFDYSNSIYCGSDKNIIIGCSKHGDFEQKAGRHLYGEGCPKCHGRNKTTEDWIEEAREVHGDEYGYSKANYLGNKHKVIITCYKHGDFEMKPHYHVKEKNKCPICREIKMVKEISYTDIKKIIHRLNLKTQREYQKWWMNNKEFCRDNGIPSNPQKFYSKLRNKPL